MDLSLESFTDEELVLNTFKNEMYFAELMKRYENKFFRYIMRRSKLSKEDAEDLMQNIFIKIYQNINDFDKSLYFSSWGYRICHNEVIDFYRRQKIRSHISFDDEENNIFENIKSEINIEKQIDLNNFKKRVELEINNLPEKYKEIITLRFLEEKEYEEISDILEISLGSVGSQISRGKKILKEKLESYAN